MPSTLGGYGDWARRLAPDPPPLSFRHDRWTDLETWRDVARRRTLARLACPYTGEPDVSDRAVEAVTDEGVHIERLSWQLPYGPPTEAFFLRPEGSEGPLPGVMALHDHGGDKYHGRRKIVATPGSDDGRLGAHRDKYYDGFAWANRLAKQGYAVLVPDGFSFGSRRFDPYETVGVREVPNPDPEGATVEEVETYNEWASKYESVAARALLCAGTTFPGAMVADDRATLDVLASLPVVDATRLGCAGLSGGGLRATYLGSVDERLRSVACVGMTTTWRDFVDRSAPRHTWMVYPPLLARDLDYPDILSIRAPKPTLVLVNEDDALFSLPEMRRADDQLSAVFEKAGAADRFEWSLHPGPHKFDDMMQREAFAWFDRTLADP